MVVSSVSGRRFDGCSFLMAMMHLQLLQMQ